MKKTTDTVAQQEDQNPEILATDQPEYPSRSLITATGVACITTTPPRLPSSAQGKAVVTRPTPHTRCPCAFCRKRAAQRRSTRRDRGQQPTPSPYTIEATIIIEEEIPPQQGNNTFPGKTRQYHRTYWKGHATQTRKGWTYLLSAAALAALLIALIWFSGLGSALGTLLFPPVASITIIPRAEQRQSSISVTAVTGQPAANQVAARILRGTSPVGTVVARASGVGQTLATVSRGTLLFYNEGPSAQTIGAGVSLTGADGIRVVTDAPVSVPAGNPPSTFGTAKVSAETLQAGSRANISAGDIGGLCCAPGISVNNTAFSGGQDAQNFLVLEQRDIDAAAGTIESGLTLQAQHQVEGQVSAAQQTAGVPQCHLQAHSADAVGSRVAQTPVNISVTCSAEAFDRLAARRVAASLFVQGVRRQLGANYKLASSIGSGISQVSVSNAQRGTLIILIRVQGTWVYQFSPAQRLGLARRIEGKSIRDALTLVANEPGVEHTSVQVTAGAQAIPADTNRISIVILPG